MIETPIRFFLGANTPSGFRDTVGDLYNPADGWRVILIKGGPGTGKSTLMKRVLQTVEGGEAFCCSSDPCSLDGVRFPEQKLLLLDATAPHAAEPRCWEVCEQVLSLSPFVDRDRLQGQRREILALAEACVDRHRRVRRCLSGMAAALAESRRIWRDALDEQTVCDYAAQLATREWGDLTGEGTLSQRFLSAVTPDGHLTFFESVQALCPRIFVIADEGGAVATLLLRELQKAALAAGQTVIACPCPLFPDSKTEHLLLPDVGTAFLTSNEFHRVDFPVYRRIHATRFADNERLQEHRQKLSFNKRAARELLDGAVTAAQEAKQAHDEWEALIAPAVDRDGVTQMTEALLQELMDR